MHIFVTGGAGFIGSHTTEALLARGDRVTVLDVFGYGYDPAIKRANAARITGLGAKLVEGDIRDRALIQRLWDADRPDVVVHLAARAGVRVSLEDPLSYTDININGTTILLDEMQKRGMDRLVFASSSSVYGARTGGAFKETDLVDVPVSPYAATKKAGELLCATWHTLYGMHATCLRFFTVYGPRQRPEMAIHLFARKILNGQEITVFGDGRSKRDYTFIDDIVAGVVAAIDRPLGYEVLNLGCGDPIYLNELVDGIGRATGNTPQILRIGDQPGDVPMTYADISKARRLLDYEPSTSIQQGLDKFVAWLRTES